MNTKLVESLALAIQALSDQERSLLEQKLFFDSSEPATQSLMQLAAIGGGFDFLQDEPDLYTAEDGEAIA
ncbi:hypothetical protein AB3R30_16335 [Leptolyngbyaceae cyanobacterium UHCC 1019]